MSITIRLDAPAVRALVSDNEEFRLELQRAVIAETVKHCITAQPPQLLPLIALTVVSEIQKVAAAEDGRYRDVLNKAVAALYQQNSRDWNNYVLAPAAKDKMEIAASKVVKAEMDRITTKFGSLAKETVDKIVADMDDRVDKRVASLVDEEIRTKVRTTVRAKVERALD